MKVVISAFSSSFIDYPKQDQWCVSIYMTGCSHNCQGCHNKELQEYKCEGSVEYSIDGFFNRLDLECKRNRTINVVILGGDPLFPENVESTKAILKDPRSVNFSFCVYTGYSKAYVDSNEVSGWRYLKYGLYSEAHHIDQDGKRHLGSSNQVMIDNEGNQLTKDGVYICQK